MLTLKQFLEGLPLYDQLFTQYGPVHFQLRGFLQLLTGELVSHDFTRLVTLAVWQLCSLSCAGFLALQTRSFFFSFLLYLQMTIYLKTFAYEPGHPQETVVLLLCLSLVAISLAQRASTRKAGFLAGGVLGALLTLTKVNVGVFYGISLAMLAANLLPRRARSEWLASAIGVACTAAPLVLMAADLRGWAGSYVALACVSVVLASWVPKRAGAEGEIDWQAAGWLWAAAALTGVAVLAVALLLGSSPQGLLQGILLGPLRQGRLWSLPASLPPGTGGWR